MVQVFSIKIKQKAQNYAKMMKNSIKSAKSNQTLQKICRIFSVSAEFLQNLASFLIFKLGSDQILDSDWLKIPV